MIVSAYFRLIGSRLRFNFLVSLCVLGLLSLGHPVQMFGASRTSTAEPKLLYSLKYSTFSDDLEINGQASTVAVTATSGPLTIWNLKSGRRIRSILPNGLSSRTIAFSSDGVLLAEGLTNNTIRIYAVKPWRLVKVLRVEAGIDEGLQFSRSGRYMACICNNYKALQVWDTRTWKLLAVRQYQHWIDAYCFDDKEGVWIASHGEVHHSSITSPLSTGVIKISARHLLNFWQNGNELIAVSSDTGGTVARLNTTHSTIQSLSRTGYSLSAATNCGNAVVLIYNSLKKQGLSLCVVLDNQSWAAVRTFELHQNFVRNVSCLTLPDALLIVTAGNSVDAWHVALDKANKS